jgi:hypothetical protein
METVFEAYIHELRCYKILCESLFFVLENNVTLKEGKVGDFTIKPTRKTILAEIQYLKQDTFPKFYIPLPPDSWVEPSIGQIEYDNGKWKFNFHGMGLSFNQGENIDNLRDVSIEFSAQGKIAVTEWTTGLFFKTNCQALPQYQEFLDKKQGLFQQAVENGYLISIEPLLPGDDQTYVFGEKLF